MKKCTKCGMRKSSKDFYSTNRTRDGLRSECKACSKDNVRKYRAGVRSKKETLLSVLQEIRDLLKGMLPIEMVQEVVAKQPTLHFTADDLQLKPGDKVKGSHEKKTHTDFGPPPARKRV